MRDYRLYFLDPAGHFLRVEAIEVEDDAAALEKARQRDHDHRVQIWCDKRKVGVVEPEGR